MLLGTRRSGADSSVSARLLFTSSPAISWRNAAQRSVPKTMEQRLRSCAFTRPLKDTPGNFKKLVFLDGMQHTVMFGISLVVWARESSLRWVGTTSISTNQRVQASTTVLSCHLGSSRSVPVVVLWVSKCGVSWPSDWAPPLSSTQATITCNDFDTQTSTKTETREYPQVRLDRSTYLVQAT